MFKRIAIISALVLFSLLLIYCTTDETTIIGPFGDASKFLKITEFTAEVDTLYSKGDSTEIQIKIIDVYGHPADSLTVNLSAQIGEIPEKVVTDSNGVAKAMYKSKDKAGLDLITANVGIKKASLLLQVIDYVPHSIDLSSETTTLLADGSKTEITAVVKDNTGKPMPNVTVTFKTTHGTLNSTIEQTNDQGIASVELTSSDEVVTATVNATATVSSSIDINFVIVIPYYLDLTSETPVLLADQLSKTKITAIIRDSTLNVMPDIIVHFETTDGTLNPSSGKVKTDENGEATIELTSSDEVVTATVNATATISSSINIDFVMAIPRYLDLTTSTPILLADGISKATITATPRDETGNIMPGISVMFSTTQGTIVPTIALTDSKGEAKVELTSSTFEGTALVVATSYITSFLEVKFRNYVPHFMEIFSDKSVLVADGVSTATITATPKDSTGVPMAGVNVLFSSNLGALSPVMDISDGDGKATTVLSAGDIYGTATVTATSSVNNSVNIEFITYSPTSISLSTGNSNASILANGLSSIDVSATVKNTIGELVGGVRVNFLTTAGTLNKQSTVTNSEGVATVSLTSSGAISDNMETITATIDGTSIVDNIGIRFRGITLSTIIDSTAIHNGGKFVVYVKARAIETSNGVSVTDVATSFSTTQGELAPTLVALDQDGMANSILITDITSIDQNGIYITSALSAAPMVSAQSQEITIPGLEILLSTLDDDIVGDGSSTTAVKAVLRKATGNEAVPFKRVSWQTDIGTIVESSVTNFLGETVDTIRTELVYSTQTATITANFGQNVVDNTPLTFLAPKPEKLILGFEPDTTAGPCVTLEAPDTCVYGIDSYGNLIVGPEGSGAIYCGHPDDTWCYRLCGQDLIKGGSWGTRDIAVTALFKNVLNNPIRNEDIEFWLAPENAPAVICEYDETTNNNGRARVIITYSIQYAGEVVRIWARSPVYDVTGYVDIILPSAF